MLSLADFIEREKITAIARPRKGNPNMDSSVLMFHWTVTLFRPGASPRGTYSMSVPFSQGTAHSDPPTAHDVLECLVMDAATFENASSFSEWCADLGMNDDSRKAEKIFRAVKRQSFSLQSVFLGNELYRELLSDVECE